MLERIKYELFKQRHIREIFLLYLIVLSVLFLTIYTSLAVFEKNGEVGNATVVKSGSLAVNLTSSTNTYNTETGEIIVEAKTKRIFNITVTNNTKTKIKYKLYYEVIQPTTLSSDVKIGIIDSDESIIEEVGNINIYNTNQIGIINNSDKEIKLKIWYKLGYGHNEIILDNGQNNFEKLDNLLSYKILANNDVSTEKPEFTNVLTTNKGMFRDEDIDGDTYYFRGADVNNYVKFEGLTYKETYTSYLLNGIKYSTEQEAINACDNYTNLGYSSNDECKSSIINRSYNEGDDILFRIVRINGDNTIRLISDRSIITSTYNDLTNDEKYVGYTYDNSAPNVQDGNISTIKNNIDTWYINTMTNYDSMIANARYCNDTSVNSVDTNNTIIYNSKNRINLKMPSLICEETTKTYGGEYTLKAGIITGDEVMLAGGLYGIKNNSYYIYDGNNLLTGTPASFNNNGMIYTVNKYGDLISSDVDTIYDVKPVINVVNNMLYTSGDGSINNPYIIK